MDKDHLLRLPNRGLTHYADPYQVVIWSEILEAHSAQSSISPEHCCGEPDSKESPYLYGSLAEGGLSGSQGLRVWRHTAGRHEGRIEIQKAIRNEERPLSAHLDLHDLEIPREKNLEVPGFAIECKRDAGGTTL
jgi:hypothetical protein